MGFLGSTKMDGVKRVSLIKPAADILNVKIGDYIVFYEIDGVIVIDKAPTFEQDIDLKEKLLNLNEEELKEKNRLLHNELGIDALSFEKKNDHTYTMKWADGITEEKAEEIINGTMKNIMMKHELEEDKIVKRLERLQNMSEESIENILEYGDVLDAFDKYVEKKMSDEEENEFFRKIGKAMNLDSEELVNFINTVNKLTPQKMDSLVRITGKKAKENNKKTSKQSK